MVLTKWIYWRRHKVKSKWNQTKDYYATPDLPWWDFMVVDIHFCNTFSTNLIQPSLTSLWAQFMYHIIFYSFKHDPSPCDILAKIEKVWFRGYGSVSFGPFAWASPCMLPSGQGTLVAPQAHGGGLVSKISTSKQL